MLFALRYSGDYKVTELMKELELAQIKNAQIVDMVMKYAGDCAKKLVASESGFVGKFTKVFKEAFKEIPNVFTQHKSLMHNVVEATIKGKLKDLDYPATNTHIANEGIEDIIVFIVGGATYQEAREVHEFKEQGHNLLLGGTGMHNSKSFLADIIHLNGESNAAMI